MCVPMEIGFKSAGAVPIDVRGSSVLAGQLHRLHRMNRLLCLAFACSAALSASAGAGYLALIGPAPLRFEGRGRSPERARAQLPPLVMQDSAPSTNAVAPALGTNAVAEVTTPTAPIAPPVAPPQNLPVVALITNLPPVTLLPTPLPPPTGPLLGPWMDPNDPSSLLTAQMLIHYFRPFGTNAPGTTLLTPLFNPPRPASSPPSSTVRYSTP